MSAELVSGLDRETELSLTEFVMNCPELVQLEALLSKFNVFRVLGAARHEIRHSNMLAWLLQPDESHGLGDRFLRRWLMQTIYEAGLDMAGQLGLPSPIEIDALEIDEVRVAREDSRIDLLVVIRASTGGTWVICVENKVESSQHSSQLQRYRDVVERRFPDAEHRVFILLSKYPEEPEDGGFIRTSYELVADVLARCLDERSDVIGSEPKFLLGQYLELLREDFLSESRAADLARQIYKSHRKAIDFILENRDDPILQATRAMEQALRENEAELGIVIDKLNKGWVRFTPRAWLLPQNSGGTAWGPNSRYLLCEVCFWTRRAELHMTVGKAPDVWADKVWQRAALAPFKQEWKKRPAQYIKLYKAKSTIEVATLAEIPPEDAKVQLLDWLRSEVDKTQFKQGVEVLREALNELKPVE